MPTDHDDIAAAPLWTVDGKHGRRLTLGGLHPIDLFDAWMFAEADAGLALAAWRDASRDEKADAYAAYAAALDRETQACRLLQGRLALQAAA
jgi:hypothetical protein